MTRSITAAAVFLIIAGSVAGADSELPPDEPPRQAATPSSNFGKSEDRFLPGEEVVGPTGKTVKVWSTKGPVSVSPAPEPFEDEAEKRLPENLNIVVEEDNLYHRRRDEHPRDERIPNRGGRDTFEVPGVEIPRGAPRR